MILKTLVQRLRWWWNGRCSKHGIEFSVKGFYDDKYCSICWDEQHNNLERKI